MKDYDLLGRAQVLGRVALIVGGDSHEREISFMSLERVSSALTSLHIPFSVIDLSDDFLSALRAGEFSRAMILAHGKNGEDGRLQGLLDLLSLPYTGSGALAASQGYNKWVSKLIWSHAGLSVPRGFFIHDYEECIPAFTALSSCVVVKPMRGGSTQGVHIVDKICDLRQAYEAARQFDDIVILEEFIEGIEVTCAFYEAQALPVIAIQCPGPVYDYHEKYFGTKTRYLCPSGLSDELNARIQSMTQAAARALQCRFWGRVDAIVKDQVVYLLEMNIAPGLTYHSLYPMALQAANIPFEFFLIRLLESARVG